MYGWCEDARKGPAVCRGMARSDEEEVRSCWIPVSTAIASSSTDREVADVIEFVGVDVSAVVLNDDGKDASPEPLTSSRSSEPDVFFIICKPNDFTATPTR